jgi:hypothetical protein
LTIVLLDAEFYFISRFDGFEQLRVLSFVYHGHKAIDLPDRARKDAREYRWSPEVPHRDFLQNIFAALVEIRNLQFERHRRLVALLP